jgi:hypothetical protein
MNRFHEPEARAIIADLALPEGSHGRLSTRRPASTSSVSSSIATGVRVSATLAPAGWEERSALCDADSPALILDGADY